MVHLTQPVAGWTSRLRESWPARRLTWIFVVAAACLISAWSAGIAQPTSSRLIFLDVGVGLIFVAAAAPSRGPAAQRAWFVAVGLAWPLGVLAPTRSLHAALLLVALAVFPSGRIRRAWQVVVAGVAVIVGLQLSDQLAVAAAFACCALGSGLARRRRQVGTPYAALSALGVSGVLATSWCLARFQPDRFRPSAAVVAYEAVLVLVAVAYVVVQGVDTRRRTALADRLVANTSLSGLSGLETLLGEVLHDPELRILTGRHRPPPAGKLVLTIVDDSTVAAQVVHRARALDDPATAAGVSAAVRLTMIQERRQAELAQRVAELEAARVRMIASVDAERQRAADSLRADLDTLEWTAANLTDLTHTGSAEDGRILEIVREQITETSHKIEDLVAGMPPVALGSGRLRSALGNLTAGSPLPVSITVGPDADAGAEQERALYYVCLEALTNAVKHAHASSVRISLTRVGDTLTLIIRDDGAGGADPSGSGLLGLADRLAAYGGLLQVRGAPGAGTAVTVTIPITRSSATASRPAPTRGPAED